MGKFASNPRNVIDGRALATGAAGGSGLWVGKIMVSDQEGTG